MDSLKDILQSRVVEKKKAPAYQFQELALQIIKSFGADAKDRSSIFRYCKLDYNIALKAFNDCKELGKMNAPYFFKLLSVWRQKQKQ